MIPRNFIQEWSSVVPWQEPRQIEQDLIITNAILKIYNHPGLREMMCQHFSGQIFKLFFVSVRIPQVINNY